MRDIEGIERAVEVMRPHFADVERHFNAENDRFKASMASDHDTIGQILKCHLTLEMFLTRYLSAHFGLADLDAAKLSFFQKAMLLPQAGTATAFVKPGILAVNTIRNRFSHTLAPDIDANLLAPMETVIRAMKEGVPLTTPVEKIAAFTTVACAFLIVMPKELESLVTRAFSEIRINRL